MRFYRNYKSYALRTARFVKGYPRGVISLSSIECFERFGFYATQGILVLYAAASFANGGLGWTNANALRLTGIFSALVYATPVVGGWIADKYMGRKRAMALGNILMFIGYVIMTQRGEFALIAALTLIAIGTGFLKPTISAMVGEFYDAKADASRDSGFAIFYMSINIGGFFGPIVSGFLAQSAGYSFAFASAAVGMGIALINTFISMKGTLKGVGNLEKRTAKNVTEKVKWTKEETKRVWVYIGLCISNIVWNIFYALPYGLLTLWAETNVNRSIAGWKIPAAWFYAGYSVLIVLFSPVIASVYKGFDRKKKDFTLSYKLSSAYFLLAAGCLAMMPFVLQITHNRNYVGSMSYLIVFYIFFAFSELLTIPVLLSAATKFAPIGFSATLVSLNMLISWSIGGLLGGEVSALTETYDPTYIFIIMIVACVIFGLGHIFTNCYIERAYKADSSKSGK
jgi:proton-dependent oligopeptide transporter, POT family